MKRCALFFVVLVSFWFEPTLAQFKRPHQVAYNPTDKKFVVSNRQSGDIITIDANKSTSTVITGLDRPRGIFFGSIGGNSAVAILDSNLIRLFDPSSYQPFINLTVPNALGLEDAVLHPSNSDVFFLTDPASGRVIKATVGSPPFYPVTFTTFNDDIPKPNAMLIDHKGRLLVASDTTDGGIYSLNLTSGKETLVKSLNLDNINSITQDGQNNYYISNWGDDYVYRFNANLTDSVRVTSYSNPAGMIYHAPKDELVIACSGCNKVEFVKLHQFELTGGFNGCPGDDFEVFQSFWFRSIGTFASNNRFILELSDGNGSFQSATTLAVQDTTEFPGSFSGTIPPGTSGTRYVRVRSTNPVHFSKGFECTISSAPQRPTLSPNDVEGCSADTVYLGRSMQQNVRYSWSATVPVSDSTSHNPWVILNGSDSISVAVLARDTVSGCETTDSIDVYSNRPPTILFPDTFVQCGNDTLRFPAQSDYNGSYRINGIEIGVGGFPDFWVSGYQQDTVLSFQFVSDENSCVVRDTAPYIYRDIRMRVISLSPCETDAHVVRFPNIHYSGGEKYTGVWTSTDLTISYTANKDTVEIHLPGKAGMFKAFGQVNAEGCIFNGSVTVDAVNVPEFDPSPELSYSVDSVYAELTGVQGNYSVTWFRNLKAVGSGMHMSLGKGGEVLPGDSIRAMVNNGWCRDSTEWVKVEYSVISVGSGVSRHLDIFPNPTSGVIHLPEIQNVNWVQITSVDGKTRFIPYAPKVDLHTYGLSSGLYWIAVGTSNGVLRSWVVVSGEER